MKKNSFISILKKIFILVLCIYAIYIFFTQQASLDSFASNAEYYTDKISEEKEHKDYLLKLKNNINSLEYIEQIAREKLNMYYPNEKVYVDIKN